MLQIGDWVNGVYEITQVINDPTQPNAQGAMAAVFKASDVSRGGQTVAIKVLYPDEVAARMNLDRDDLVARFVREGDTLKQLNAGGGNKRIPAFVEAGECDVTEQANPGQAAHVHYLAMEWLEGQTLDKFLAANPKLGWDQLRALVLHLLQAINYLHRQTPPFILRDLKPENVMVAPDGEVRIFDFGIVKRADPQQRLTLLLQMGQTGGPGTKALGSGGWAAPEQYAPAGQTTTEQPTPVADIWAVGMIAFVAATGLPPSAPYPPDPIDKTRPDLPPELSAIVAKATRYKKAERWQTAEEMMKAIRVIGQAPPPPRMAPTTTLTNATPAPPATPPQPFWNRSPIDLLKAAVQAAGNAVGSKRSEKKRTPQEAADDIVRYCQEILEPGRFPWRMANTASQANRQLVETSLTNIQRTRETMDRLPARATDFYQVITVHYEDVIATIFRELTEAEIERSQANVKLQETREPQVLESVNPQKLGELAPHLMDLWVVLETNPYVELKRTGMTAPTMGQTVVVTLFINVGRKWYMIR